MMKQISPTKAIRLKCLDCTGNQKLEIRVCSTLECPLWRYRLGLNPNTLKNSKNPFLQPHFFEGLDNMEAIKVIKIIKKKIED